jgi:ATP-binding cassette, subfamily B, bacterial
MTLETTVSIPVPVQRCLESAGLDRRPIRLSTCTDISLDGGAQQQWLVATDDEISIVTETDGSRAARHLAWCDVDAVRTVVGVGSGILQAQLAGQWTDLLRFSNTLAHRFHKVARVLDVWAQEGGPGAEVTEPVELDPPKCPDCDLRLASREDRCPRCLPRGQLLQRAGELIAPYWRGALGLCLLTIVGVVAELIPPKLQQYMVDQLLTQSSASTPSVEVRAALLVVVLTLAASRVALSAVGVVKGRLATAIGSGLTCSLRKEMVSKLQHLAVAYYDRHQVGSMISRVAHDSEVLHGLMHQLTGGFLLQTVQLLGVGAMLVWLNPKLAMYTLIPVPLVFAGTWVFWRSVYPRYYRLWDASSKQMSVLSGMLSGIRIVKAFAQEDREYRRFETAAERLRDWRLWVEHASSRYAASMQLVFSLGGLIVWYVGGRDVIGQQMTLGQLIAFLAYLSMFYAPLGALSNFTAWLTSFLSGSQRVFELLDTPVTVQEPDSPTQWKNPRGEIRFEQVTFGYDRHQPVLKDVSFDVRPGEMVGIVGRSGSGKSTMVNLLSRLYDVQHGRITIDGIDLRQLSTHQLRQHLGIVFQDSFLFRGTIWNNLAYGRPDTTPEQGLAAAKAAGAHDFVCRAPFAYETQLGEHGAGLSGGEKQRLSIARTLLYDPKILVLDEATSNIDAEAEKCIQEALDALIKGRTTIAIAHRLSTLRNADRILVFDRGRLVEQGSHAALLQQDGVYARLVKIQTQVSKDPNVDRLLMRADTGVSDTGAARPPGADAAPLDPSSAAPATQPGPAADTPSAEKLRWLEPDACEFRLDEHGQVKLHGDGDLAVGQSVFVVCAFPATHPERYLSVRHWHKNGDDIEIGLIRDLDQWPAACQHAARQSLRRHYLLRRIERVHQIQLAAGYLQLEVETETGRTQFVMRWTQSQALDFAVNGKLLIDTDDNHYVVSDVDALPRRDRERFLQYVYW